MRTPGHDSRTFRGLSAFGRHRDTAPANRLDRAVSRPRCGKTDNVVAVELAEVDLRKMRSLTRESVTRGAVAAPRETSIGRCTSKLSSLVASQPVVTAALIQHSPASSRCIRRVSRQGVLHGAAVVSRRRTLVKAREDFGRHNAVDKVLGWALLSEQLPLAGAVLFVSGRISFEIVQKALAARIGVVAGISAPTSLAVDFARASGQTLVGFVRDGRANVYAGALQ